MNVTAERFSSAPGSLLLTGEYLITEEGGTGLALAAGGRAHLHLQHIPSSSRGLRGCTIRGKWPGGGELWKVEDGAAAAQDSSAQNPGSLASAVWKECRETPENQDSSSPPDFCLMEVDTREFFTADGFKLGYGSSAAAALLYARGLMETDGFSDEHIEHIINCALRAHRNWQGGRGSGYDIYTSAFGAAGRFTGGEKPHWDILNWPSGLKGWLIRGEKTVSSSAAIPAFQNWKKNTGTAGKRLLSDFSGEISDLASLLGTAADADPAAVLESLANLAEYGIHLGDEIGVSAVPRLPGETGLPAYRRGSMILKSLGAGNETILLLCLDDGLSHEEKKILARLENAGTARTLNIEYSGLRDEDVPDSGLKERFC